MTVLHCRCYTENDPCPETKQGWCWKSSTPEDTVEKVQTHRKRWEGDFGVGERSRMKTLHLCSKHASEFTCCVPPYEYLSWLSRGPLLPLMAIHYSPLSALILYSPLRHLLPEPHYSCSSFCLLHTPIFNHLVCISFADPPHTHTLSSACTLTKCKDRL